MSGVLSKNGFLHVATDKIGRISIDVKKMNL